MAEWHIDQLNNELLVNGWQVVDKKLVDDERTTAVWVIRKHEKEICLKFEGYDENGVFPFSKSFGCLVEGNENVSLYLPKRKPKKLRPNSDVAWSKELSDFLSGLSALS